MSSPFGHVADRQQRLIARVCRCLAVELGDRAAAASTDAGDLCDCLSDQHRLLLRLAAADGAGVALSAMPPLREATLRCLREQSTDVPSAWDLPRPGVSSWLSEAGADVEHALGPVFIQGRLDAHVLDRVRDSVGPTALGQIVSWLNLTLEAEVLLDRLGDFWDWFDLHGLTLASSLQQSGADGLLRELCELVPLVLDGRIQKPALVLNAGVGA